jgi:electron transfer flavoprotein alpha subunit/transcriptional regulator with XRE-family HTH domain
MSAELSNEIWVFGDLRNERLLGFGFNLLTKARQLAEQLSATTSMVAMGSPTSHVADRLSDEPVCLPLEMVAEQLISHGADRVYLLENQLLGTPRPDVFASALAAFVKERRPKLMLFPLTDFGRELASRTASMCELGLIADAVEIKLENDAIVALCPSWGGEIMAAISFSDAGRTGFITMPPHASPPAEIKGNPGITERISIPEIQIPQGLNLLSQEVVLDEQQTLETADIVVAGGAGLSDMDGFSLIRNLAAVIGGQVGATRPPVLQHWIEEERLIGQTGKTVRPQLMITVGTSGAIQYTAGIMESDMIVAINRDPQAPIFHVADMGIVADAKSFLPLLTDKLKQVVMRSLTDMLCEETAIVQNSGMGAKIKSLRAGLSWSLEKLAQATGQTPDFVAQVENGAVSPSVSFILRLAKALDIDPGTFLHKEERVLLRDRRTEAFVRRTREYAYQTLTPGAENDHLRAFLVTIESRQDHKPVAYKHEGEEFIYVLDGDLEFTLDKKIHRLKAGESIHFNSDIPHKLKSISDDPTRCLVVLFTI